jgi:hypothetical protein
MSEATIFITIPAYEDPKLLSTIDDALSNALFPERLFFCIGLQYNKLPDISKYINNPNFKFLYYDVETRPGVYYIRREMAAEHSGQDYFLMIDSHMVFDKYWDAAIINDYRHLQLIHGEKTIISRPVPEKVGITSNNGHINDKPGWEVLLENGLSNIERLIVPSCKNVPWQGESFVKSSYACSHFFFTSKNFLAEVPFHEGIRSYCEELTITISAYVSGWDIYMNPLHVAIGHDPQETTMAIYGKKDFSIAQGKKYLGIYDDSDNAKLEISKFLLGLESTLIKITNPARTADEYWKLCDMQEIQQELKNYLGFK